MSLILSIAKCGRLLGVIDTFIKMIENLGDHCEAIRLGKMLGSYGATYLKDEYGRKELHAQRLSIAESLKQKDTNLGNE